MRPGAILDLREIGLAQTAADLALHGGGQFLLSHRTAPATERALDGAKGAEFVAKFHGSLPVITICKVYIAICNLSSEIGTPFLLCISLNLNELLNWPCKEGPQTSLRRKPNLFRLPQRLQIDSQLLALLIQMAALQSQCPRHICHVEIVAPNFPEHRFFFECFGALGQRARCISSGGG